MPRKCITCELPIPRAKLLVDPGADTCSWECLRVKQLDEAAELDLVFMSQVAKEEPRLAIERAEAHTELVSDAQGVHVPEPKAPHDDPGQHQALEDFARPLAHKPRVILRKAGTR